MGRGRSGKKTSTAAAANNAQPTAASAPPQDFPEAFQPGVDLEAAGWVNHSTRTVTNTTQRQWDAFTAAYQSGMTAQDESNLFKDYDYRTGELYGYVRTTNSFKINEALYDPNNAGKTDAQIFTRQDRTGRYRDLETIQSLDKGINTHVTQADASYTRFCGPNSLTSSYSLSTAEIGMLSQANGMTPQQLALLNQGLAGRTGYSNAYTSTSANRSMNAFSRKYTYERRINVPKGTRAFAVRGNAQESEVIFGRRMETRLTHVSIANDGHIVLHETFVRYR